MQLQAYPKAEEVLQIAQREGFAGQICIPCKLAKSLLYHTGLYHTGLYHLHQIFWAIANNRTNGNTIVHAIPARMHASMDTCVWQRPPPPLSEGWLKIPILMDIERLKHKEHEFTGLSPTLHPPKKDLAAHPQ
uniref:Uncharacterized protein n=1 Tax=Eutreptiella gymnastica TaxID=73025 RepID=A0A7S1I4Y7_9EUGL|mmetsp:Transcript_130634/g.225934  ORF Transcript_130634/g.225934 Transcript_130634/m.225934 type:complete len:133 (+) Transcript_130634:144-542(+)